MAFENNAQGNRSLTPIFPLLIEPGPFGPALAIKYLKFPIVVDTVQMWLKLAPFGADPCLLYVALRQGRILERRAFVVGVVAQKLA